MAINLKVRRVYGKPWSKMMGPNGQVTKELLEMLGQVLVEEVIREARKEYARQGGMRTAHGKPEGMPGPRFKFDPPWGHIPHEQRHPGVPSFYDSFNYKVLGPSSVGLTCNWPWIDEIIKGRPPFKMDWLTRQNGVEKVPLVLRDGTVIVRMAPATAADAWIHPGFKKHNFINRAVKKARIKAASLAKEVITRNLAVGDPTK